MSRKSYQGSINNKERSKQKLIEAVGAVIKTKGYTGLTATNIAKEAGLNRRLIDFYFSSLEELIETYVRGKDYWVAASGNAGDLTIEDKTPNTQKILASLLTNQLAYFNDNEEMQKVILWQISESSRIMKDICDEREQLSRVFFELSDKELKGKDIDLRAVSALLVAGVYYLVLHAKSTASTFCEIDLNTADGLARIKDAISFVLKRTYD